MKPHRIAIAMSVLTFTGLLGGVSAASAATAPYCGITWGSQPKIVLQSTGAPVTNARTGRHYCWDRLVIDLNGLSATGYDVRYIDALHQGGLESGTVVPVAGGAIVQVRAFAPASVPWSYGDHIKTPGDFSAAGYRTFRDLVYAGSDGFNTDFAVGVRARLPFRVFTLTGPGSTSRLVIDIGHQW